MDKLHTICIQNNYYVSGVYPNNIVPERKDNQNYSSENISNALKTNQIVLGAKINNYIGNVLIGS